MKLRKTNDNRYMFYCEGCMELHGPNDSWNFNGDYEKPTFKPSIQVKSTVQITDDESHRIMQGEKIKPRPKVCHSFVTDGKIQYLNDCTTN